MEQKVGRLKQLKHLRGEVEMLQARIDELEMAAQGGVRRISGMPRGTRGGDRVARYATSIADLRTLLEEKRDACFGELTRLYAFVEQIDDSLTRQVMIYRYVDGMSWQQVAIALGEADEQYPRRLHNKFLKNCKFDENDERNVL